MKEHKDKGKLIKMFPKDECYDEFLPKEFKNLWLFIGNERINENDCWCFLSIITNKGFHIVREPHRSWQATLKSNGYVVEILS